jgi:hypothetical protein
MFWKTRKANIELKNRKQLKAGSASLCKGISDIIISDSGKYGTSGALLGLHPSRGI